MTTRELVARTRLTPRIVQWWTDHGILRVTLDGHARIFDDEQALTALIVRELRRKGLGLAQIARWKLAQPKADYLVVSGDRALWSNQAGVIAHATQADCGCYVVAIEDLRAELKRFNRYTAANGRAAAYSPPRSSASRMDRARA